MKYIKTPLGTIEIVAKEQDIFFNELNETLPCYLVSKHNDQDNIDYRYAYKKQDCKEADNINDLLDEYMVVDGDQNATFKNFDLANWVKGTLYGQVFNQDGISTSVARYDKKNKEWVLL